MTDTGTLRIACLEPSATAICIALGLADAIVGVTHECHELVKSIHNHDNIRILTKDGLPVTSQRDIHEAVQEAAAAKKRASVAICPAFSSSSTTNVLADSDIPSLYPLLADQLLAARPTVIFTQDLCAVCAPTVHDVHYAIQSKQDTWPCQIVSLQPQTIHEVAETFVTVARACGILERGVTLRDTWLAQFQQLQDTIIKARDTSTTIPRMLVLEWLDPPFDGGHWTYQMMDYAQVINANSHKDGVKSTQIEWSYIEETCCPDVIVVGCCGFDLERNLQDAKEHAARFARLEHASVYCCNGNTYIAQPGPSLLQGAVILAKCAYQDHPNVLAAIDALGFLDPHEEATAWKHVNIDDARNSETANSRSKPSSSEPPVADLEDMVMGGPTSTPDQSGFAALHKDACERGEKTYIDPDTGYSVFTSLAHTQRGWCCGSGCRHCPFGHENVKDNDKTRKIQQPSILYQIKEASPDESPALFSIRDNRTVKVLFFSGGKDSFLTLRALVRQSQKDESFGLVLLTTFDATTRMIAHQNVKIDNVVQQAQHLNITLLGIPLRRSSGETYQDRIQQGLTLLNEQVLPKASRLISLVFGDLHLLHIQDWRNKSLMTFDCDLEYPLWKVPYEMLLQDLQASKVPCTISASDVDSITVGTVFDRSLYQHAESLGIDGFGEQGEFHSLAQVWQVPRETALGIID